MKQQYSNQPFPTADMPWERTRSLGITFAVVESLGALGSLWYLASGLAQTDENAFAILGVLLGACGLAFFVPALAFTAIGLATRRGGLLFAGKFLTLAGVLGGPFALMFLAFFVLGALG